MVMDPFDYDLGWDSEPNSSDDEWIDGFAVPYRLRFLLPVINTVHIATLWTKYRVLHYGAMIPRKVFLFYPNHLREDFTAEVIFFDNEEQDTYTRQLQKEDIMRNEGYAKVFSLLIISPFPLFVIRLAMLRFTFLDAISMLSLVLSAWGIPAVRTDSLAVVLPGQWKLFFLRMNIYLAAVIALHVVFSPPGRATWDMNGAEQLWLDDVKHFGILPMIMALTSHCARRFMEAVNMVELEHIRYSYLPQSRGGILDVPLVPLDPPGPPPELPPSAISPQQPAPPGSQQPGPPGPQQPVPPGPQQPAPPGPQQPAPPGPQQLAPPPNPQPNPPKSQMALPSTGPLVTRWTRAQYSFSFRDWTAALFAPMKVARMQVGIRTEPQTDRPPAAPAVRTPRALHAHYAACLEWQRKNWPSLLLQRYLLALAPRPAPPGPPIPRPARNRESDLRFLTLWSRFQTGEWEAYAKARTVVQPNIPAPPAPPVDATMDGNETFYMAIAQWHNMFWETMERAQGKKVAAAVAADADQRWNRELLDGWTAWQSVAWDDVQLARREQALAPLPAIPENREAAA